MKKTKQWDIWLAEVGFQDSTESKIRPILIMGDNVAFVMSYPITSHKPRDNFFGEYDIQYWKQSGLDKPSTIRMNRMIKIDKINLKGKIGVLDRFDIDKVSQLLMLLSGLIH